MTSTPSEIPDDPETPIPADDSIPEWPSGSGSDAGVEPVASAAEAPPVVPGPPDSSATLGSPTSPTGAPPWSPPWSPPAAEAPQAAPAWSPPPPGTPTGWAEQVPQPGVRYDVPQDQKNLAMISTLGMIIVGFISPLIVFILTNGEPTKKFANDHAKEGLNFCIASFIASIVTVLLMFVLIGFLLIPVLIGWSIWVIVAGSIQANHGEAPHYPLVPKILK